MIRKILSILVLLPCVAWAADISNHSVIRACFAPLPKPLQKIVMDYYGKHQLTQYQDRDYTELGFGPIDHLRFVSCYPETLALRVRFAHSHLNVCKSVPSNTSVGDILAFHTSYIDDTKWFDASSTKTLCAISDGEKYMAFPIGQGGTKARVLKLEDDPHYAQLVAILGVQDKSSYELATQAN